MMEGDTMAVLSGSESASLTNSTNSSMKISAARRRSNGHETSLVMVCRRPRKTHLDRLETARRVAMSYSMSVATQQAKIDH